MPTVPTSFVPQVADQGAGQVVPFEATPGQPMQNLAPEQGVRMGAATTDTGNVMYRIGSTIQDKINEANAKEADVQMFTRAQDILRGKDGYFNALGKDAELRLEQTRSALADVAKSIEDGLPNDTSKRMFRQAAARNLAVYDGQMMEHRNKEVTKFEITSATARMEVCKGRAIDSYRFRGMRQRNEDGSEVAIGPFHEDVALAIREQEKIAAMVGIPSDSDQMKAMRRTLLTDITEGVAQRLASENNYRDALEFVKEQKRAGNLETKAAEQMLERLTAQSRTQQAEELANSIMQFGTLNTPSGSGNYMIPVSDASNLRTIENGAWQFQVKPYTPVVAPIDGRVIESKDDPKRGHMIALELSDGTIAKFWGIDPNVSVQVGQFVQRGAAIGLPDIGPDKRGYFTYSLERDGVRVDPSTVNSLEPRDIPYESRPPADEGEATAIATDRITDTLLRDATIARMQQKYNQMNAAAAATTARIEAQLASQMLNGDAPDPQLLSRLPAKRQKQILEDRRKETSLDIQLQIAQSGGVVTDAFILAHRGEMTKQDLIAVYEKRNALGREQDAMDAATIRDFFYANGLPQYAKPDPSNPAEVAEALRMTLKLQERMRQEHKDRGTKIGPTEQRKILDQAFLDNAFLSGTAGWFSGDRSKSMLMMTETEETAAYVMVGDEKISLAVIPDTFRNAARKAAISEGSNPSAEYIAQLWVSKGKPTR